MATHSSIIDWRIPWTEKPGRLNNPGVTKRQTPLSNKHFRFHVTCIQRALILGDGTRSQQSAHAKESEVPETHCVLFCLLGGCYYSSLLLS